MGKKQKEEKDNGVGEVNELKVDRPLSKDEAAAEAVEFDLDQLEEDALDKVAAADAELAKVVQEAKDNLGKGPPVGVNDDPLEGFTADELFQVVVEAHGDVGLNMLKSAVVELKARAAVDKQRSEDFQARKANRS